MDWSNLWHLFKAIKVGPADIKILFVWFVCYLVASLVPIWGSALLIRFDSSAWPALFVLGEDGQFALLASSLLGSVFYTLFGGVGKGRFPGDYVIGPLALILICTSFIVFSWTVSSSESDTRDPNAVFVVSMILYFATLLIAVICLLIESHAKDLSDEISKNQVINLGRNVAELVDEGADA